MKHLYLIILVKDGDISTTLEALVKRESHFQAEDAAKEWAKKIEGYKLHTILHKDSTRLDSGEVVSLNHVKVG